VVEKAGEDLESYQAVLGQLLQVEQQILDLVEEGALVALVHLLIREAARAAPASS